uniref:Uncharacterized protein n=1 Tax=Glossina austeni TaxID=7395 RepID=A0A1A9VJU8_GLOAU
MKVIYYTNGNIKPEENTKHVINFFGVLGCIKVNARDKNPHKKQGKSFQKELNAEEKKFNRRIVSLWLCFAILSTASIVSLYLAYQNQKSKKVLTGLVFTSVVLSILATVCFAVFCLWMFFDSNFIKKNFVEHRIKSFLENEVSSEWIKCYKKELIGEDSEIDVEACDQESGKNKDIEDIIEFLWQRKKFVALYNFLTNGEKLVQAGMAMVNMLLVKGINPNNIVLDTNSLGGGVAAEVLKSCCGLEFNSQEVIENTKCPVLIVGRKGDTVIPQEAQLVGKLPDSSTSERFRWNIVLEHDPQNTECKSKNIHTDHKEHLVYHEDNGSIKKSLASSNEKLQWVTKGITGGVSQLGVYPYVSED